MTAALLAAGALLLAGHADHPMPTTPAADPATPSTEGPVVTMAASAYVPRDVVALVGETVTWTNTDTRTHTVTDASAEEYDSGSLAPGTSFEHAFDLQGTYRFQCTIHRFMSGFVHVYGLALQAPTAGAPVGGSVRLSGRAPSGTARVIVERRPARGAFAPVGAAMVAEDGTFTVRVRLEGPGAFRVRSGELASPAVAVPIVPAVHAHGERLGAQVVLDAMVDPPRAGSVQLQRYVRERFTWRTVARAALPPTGRASFRVRARDEVWLRVRVSGLGGGYSVGVSRAVHVAAARP